MIYNTEGQSRSLCKDKVTLITVLDMHLSPVTPASRKDDYAEATEEAWGQILRFAEKVGAEAILLAGDIYHLKTASRNPPGFLRRNIKMFKDAQRKGIDVLAIAGNHDLTFGSLVSLDNQPIGVLVEAEAVHLLDGKPVVYNAKGFSVKVAGGSFNHSQAAHVRDLKKEGADRLVAMGHFWYGPETGEYFGEPVYGPGFFKGSEADVLVIGHHHADMGMPTIDGKVYCVHGPIS